MIYQAPFNIYRQTGRKWQHAGGPYDRMSTAQQAVRMFVRSDDSKRLLAEDASGLAVSDYNPQK